MSADRLIASHLRLAAEALDAARILRSIGNRYAVYQAEQAVEQLILALAQSENIAFSRSQQHQLETMRRTLPEHNTFRQALADLTWLEAYATTCRYPKTMGGLAEPPSIAKLQDAIAAAGQVTDGVAQHFGVDLNPASKTPASHVRPPRA